VVSQPAWIRHETAAKQVELSACPYVTEAYKTQLSESARSTHPVDQSQSCWRGGQVVNEVVMFRLRENFL